MSVIVDPAQDLAKLITLADQALHLAKSRGRNRVGVAPLEVSFGNEMPECPIAHAPEQSAAQSRAAPKLVLRTASLTAAAAAARSRSWRRAPA